jgi:hypothetical protein
LTVTPNGAGTVLRAELDQSTTSGSYNTVNGGNQYLWQSDIQVGSFPSSPIFTTNAAATRGLPVFTEPVPSGRTRVLLTFADASTLLVEGLTPGASFDYVTPILAANKGRFGASELVTREWRP